MTNFLNWWTNWFARKKQMDKPIQIIPDEPKEPAPKKVDLGLEDCWQKDDARIGWPVTVYQYDWGRVKFKGRLLGVERDVHGSVRRYLIRDEAGALQDFMWFDNFNFISTVEMVA